MTEVRDVTSLPPTDNNKKSVLFFWASWHEDSSPGGQMDLVFRSLASINQAAVEFLRVEAESVPELSLKFGVNMVPTCVLLSESNDIVDRVDGVDPARLTQAISSLPTASSPTTAVPPSTQSAPTTEESPTPTSSTSSSSSSSPKSLDERLSQLVRASEVMLFMKGNVSKPRCGFSRQAVEILEQANIAFGTFDILSDDEVRQGLKKFSDWPTYPQLYARGELVGGMDVLKEMVADAQDDGTTLAEALEVEEVAAEEENPAEVLTIEERLQALVIRSRIMLFMKGLPSKPQCGFSRQIVDILEEENVPYDSFNIFEDDDVRQGLKKMFDWPTFPQLYVDGELVGGLDVVKELKSEDELGDMLRGEE